MSIAFAKMSKYIQGRGFRGLPLTSGIDFGLPKSLLAKVSDTLPKRIKRTVSACRTPHRKYGNKAVDSAFSSIIIFIIVFPQ